MGSLESPLKDNKSSQSKAAVTVALDRVSQADTSNSLQHQAAHPAAPSSCDQVELAVDGMRATKETQAASPGRGDIRSISSHRGCSNGPITSCSTKHARLQ